MAACPRPPGRRILYFVFDGVSPSLRPPSAGACWALGHTAQTHPSSFSCCVQPPRPSSLKHFTVDLCFVTAALLPLLFALRGPSRKEQLMDLFPS